MSDLLVGVLGGMGPDATVDFMARVLKRTPATEDQDHVRLLVDQDPTIPNRQDAILRGGPSPAPRLRQMAARLESAGADFLVMPCNTAHVFADEICDAAGIPFVSMIDVTMEGVAESGAKRIGLLATRACVASRVYEDAIEAGDLEVVSQTGEELDLLTALIARIKTGDHGVEVSARMRSLAAALEERGADTIIVGCTEIPIVLDSDAVAAPLLSSTDLLAERTVALAKRQLALPRR